MFSSEIFTLTDLLRSSSDFLLLRSNSVWSWGFFAVVKNCDKLNFEGGLTGTAAAIASSTPQQLEAVAVRAFRYFSFFLVSSFFFFSMEGE